MGVAHRQNRQRLISHRGQSANPFDSRERDSGGCYGRLWFGFGQGKGFQYCMAFKLTSIIEAEYHPDEVEEKVKGEM
jgi:hypothetical protein